MKELTLIKLGGSLITDKGKPYTAEPQVIRRLAKEIKFCWDKDFRFVVSHGSGSFGHTSAAKYQTAFGIKKKEDVFGLAVVQQDAIAINRIVNKIFLEEGLPVLSFVPSSFSFAVSSRLSVIFVKPIVEALEIDALPLVFGDVILDRVHGCCIFSGEMTLDNLISPLIKAGFTIKRIIQAGNTDGVYDKEGKTVLKIDSKNFADIKELIGGSNSTDVTGGMLHKIEESLKMAKKGIDCLIINGEKKKALLKAILGEPVQGTLVIR